MPMPSTHASLLYDLRRDSRRDDAWAAFHARYRSVIRGWCLRRGLPDDGAEDLTQDVLLKLFRQLPRYTHDPTRGPFRSWLKAIVNNLLTDFWRRQQRRPEPDAVGGTNFLQRLADLADPAAADELSDALDDHAQTTAAAVLARVRAKLKATTWLAFSQTMIEQRPAAEVAAALNLSIASVYKATYRVKRMLLQEYRHVQPSGNNPAPVPQPGDAG
jgi:RNA polymerase sigma-70 factor (ECF subfamily)